MALNANQIDSLESAVAARHDALQAGLELDGGRSRDEIFSSVTDSVADSGDTAQAHVIVDTANAELLSDLSEMRELEAAQARIAEGCYGACADCGADIAFDRLQVVPTARRCADCQAKREKLTLAVKAPSL
jgi:RNA polymerase-binding transcription factor DksA